ncbi:hypothetical protein EC991_003507 [Linnemannia zychae]|nr:hypothetical protein EC991_003507 [Linnemannia zychae]
MIKPTFTASHLKSKVDVTSPERLKIHTLTVSDVLENHLKLLDQSGMEGNAFFVADLGEIYRKHLQWTALMPRIKPYYATKCNPDPLVLRLLASLGVGFDCATKGEIKSVLKAGADPSSIVYAHPCKQNSFLSYANDKGVRMLTFDNIDELYKIRRLHPQAQCILRICVDDTNSQVRLGLKFGASVDEVGALLTKAVELDLDVIGVSFHVGSVCLSAEAFRDALVLARSVFIQAKVDHGFDFKLLDVGGGFVGENNILVGTRSTFEEMAIVLTETVDLLFEPDVRVIAEPGRYYVSSAFTLAVQVIGRRRIVHELKSDPKNTTTLLHPELVPDPDARTSSVDPGYMYYINDGIFGSFATLQYFPRDCNPKTLCQAGNFTYQQKEHQQQRGQQHNQRPSLREPPRLGKHTKAVVWGPTCASVDLITMEAYMPILENGDWVYFEDMGAYTTATASVFNGIPMNDVLYTTTERAVTKYLQDTVTSHDGYLSVANYLSYLGT